MCGRRVGCLAADQPWHVLLLLNHAGSDGKAWPSHATLARESGLSERSVWAM
ncbi:MAG TPA: helix-turn-helix domain-containing protein [Prosthecobacter sp.]